MSHARGLRELHLLFWTALCALVLALAGCSTATVTVTGGTTPTPSPTAHATPTHGGTTPTPTTAPPHAFAWFQVDSAHVPQIWASINGGVPHQITHVVPDGSVCEDQLAWSPPVFSPDLAHISAALGAYNCGDGPLQGPLSIITVSSGAIAHVPSATALLTHRDTGWINNSTIWFLDGGSGGGFYTYTLGAASATHVATFSDPEEAALRGTTLFWSNQVPPFSSSPSVQYLHRYDISTHTNLPGTISMGTVNGCACSPGNYGTPGWDASPDGSHVAYQVVTPASGSTPGITSSRFYYANADGSGASQIASYVATHSFVKMQISPNGALVAMTQAAPSPSVDTASVTSPGHSGDPNLHFYHPDAYDFPVWKWDSAIFWAADHSTDSVGTGTSKIYAYTVSSSSSALAQTGAYNPWYTIGG